MAIVPSTKTDQKDTTPKIKVGDRVLAKWLDDYWYYKSEIVQVINDSKFKIKDSISNTQHTDRLDIIKLENKNEYFEKNDRSSNW